MFYIFYRKRDNNININNLYIKNNVYQSFSLPGIRGRSDFLKLSHFSLFQAQGEVVLNRINR